MSNAIVDFLVEDHRRIEHYFSLAIADKKEIQLNYYMQFRKALLRHIKMEEKILFPAAKEKNEALMNGLIPRFRLEHGAITALMVPPPTQDLIKVIQHVLEQHDIAEEKEGGMYQICAELTEDQSKEILIALKASAEVPVHPFNEAPIGLEAAKRALIRAGYEFEKLLKI